MDQPGSYEQSRRSAEFRRFLPQAPEPRGFHFDDLPVGKRFTSVGRTITETDLITFVNFTGIANEMFTNTEYLGRSSAITGGRPVPAALAYLWCEGFGSQGAMQGTGMAMLGVTLEVHGPIFVGDTIYCETEVIEARPSRTRPCAGIVKFRSEIVKGDGVLAVTYFPIRMVRRKAAGAAEGGP